MYVSVNVIVNVIVVIGSHDYSAYSDDLSANGALGSTSCCSFPLVNASSTENMLAFGLNWNC